MERGGDAADDEFGLVRGWRQGRNQAEMRLVREELMEERRAQCGEGRRELSLWEGDVVSLEEGCYCECVARTCSARTLWVSAEVSGRMTSSSTEQRADVAGIEMDVFSMVIRGQSMGQREAGGNDVGELVLGPRCL